jgi:HlyD family secretion protein
MTQVSDLKTTAVDVLRDTQPHGNGTTSLSDRVRSLRLAGRSATAGRKSAVIPWGVSVILLLTAAAFGYRTYRLAPAGGEGALRSGERDHTSPASVADTAASTAVASSGGLTHQAKGYIIPAHQIQVSPNKVSGILDYVHPDLEEGKQFKEGDVLARIQDKDFRAHRDRAAKVLAEAERRLAELENGWPRELEQARANLAVVKAKLEYSRVRNQISVTTRNATSYEQKVEAEAQVNQDTASQAAAEAALRLIETTRKEQIEQAKHRVEQARADLTETQWMLDNCEIRAPVTGTILKKNAERGNFVNPSALTSGTGGISVSLCDMADLSDLEVDIKIQERDLAKVQIGQRCTVTPDAYEKVDAFRKAHPKGYEATVSRMMPTADRNQGAVPVRVKLTVPKAEEGLYLRPDMSVTVLFLKDEG